MTMVELSQVAEINPKIKRSGNLQPDDVLDFVPMASVFEDGSMAVTERRKYEEVSKGFTAFQDGDILVAKITPCFENNKITLAQISSRYAFGSTEFHVVRPSPEELDAKYLAYFLRQDHVRLAGERQMTGSAGQRRVPKAFLERLEIPLPSLKAQRRVAAILDQADALRRARRKSIDRLNDLAQSIFYEMFGDPIRNDRNWELLSLENFGSIDRGVSKHRPRNAPELLGGIHPLIQTGDVSQARDYICEYKSTYSDIGLRQSKMWPRGTLCITIAANIADTAILDFDSCFPDSVVGFLAKDKHITLFIHNWFKIVRNSIAAVAPAVAQKNINLKILRDLNVICPPNDLIREFGQKIQEIDSKRAPLFASDTLFETLFNSLQQRAFRGEL